MICDSAHGRWAITDKNIGNTTKKELEQEAEYLKEAIQSLENLLRALEQHPQILFAMENPATSEMWNLGIIKEAIARNGRTWEIHVLDQCAYGRRSQKPTKILTNLRDWAPKGLTGNGRCIIGTCAGTLQNKTGDRRHAEQTVANSKERRPSQGQRHGHQWDFTREAVVNAVQPELVREITSAAITQKQGLKRARPYGASLVQAPRAHPYGVSGPPTGGHHVSGRGEKEKIRKLV